MKSRILFSDSHLLITYISVFFYLDDDGPRMDNNCCSEPLMGQRTDRHQNAAGEPGSAVCIIFIYDAVMSLSAWCRFKANPMRPWSA